MTTGYQIQMKMTTGTEIAKYHFNYSFSSGIIGPLIRNIVIILNVSASKFDNLVLYVDECNTKWFRT